jgi:DNA-binding NarL/FixJ family response regulator
MTVKVLIVDDHPLVREGLIGLITAQPDFQVCGQAEGIADALQLASTTRPDVAIIDLSLGDGNGLELIKEMRSHWEDVKLLVLRMHDESLFAERVLRAGAVGYVSKHEASRTIVQALRTVLAGKLYLSQRMTEQMVQRVFGAGAGGTGSPIDRLTDREIEVFELIGEGVTIRQIAAKLQLSPKTVETHREHIKDKMQFKNATELTRHAVQWVLEHH